MSNYLTEQEVLHQLNIPDFRHITKDKVMEFASILNNMEPDVAKKAIDQFPEFSHMALEALQDYKQILDNSLNSNDKSTKRVYDIYDSVISALNACLNQENLSFEEKKFYLEQMIVVARMADQKDSENKRFNWCTIAAGATAVVFIIGFGASLLGGSSRLKLPKSKI